MSKAETVWSGDNLERVGASPYEDLVLIQVGVQGANCGVYVTPETAREVAAMILRVATTVEG